MTILMMRNIEDDKTLRELFRALPESTPSAGLDARIMERVRQEKNHVEQRSEQLMLLWTIVLSTVVLAIGAWALYITGGWKALWPETFDWGKLRLSVQWEGLSPQAAGILRTLLPYAGIVLLLLVGDLFLRRHFFLKELRKS